MIRIVFLLVTCFVFWSVAWADDYHPLYRGTRAQGMGNAFTAVADDEQAIFYNPAGLVGIKKFSFKLVTIDGDLSSDLLTQYAPISAAVSNPGVDSLNQLMGKNIYGRAQASASVVIPGFGFTAFFDQQAGIRMKNPSLPQTTFAGQTTYGGQVAFGVPLVKFKKKKGEIRLGLAGKMLWRGGGYQHPTLTQFLTMNTAAITGNLTNIGVGYGGDAGLQIVYTFKKKLTLMGGLAFTDIGNTAFSSGAQPQDSSLNAGVALRFESGDMQATLAYDYKHILDYTDFRRKIHLGLELKFPFLSLFGGLNQLYPCYGAGVDISIVKVMYVFYTEDLAPVLNIDAERRHMVHVSVKFDL